MVTIGERLKFFRKNLKISQDVFAWGFNISNKAYWNYENNLRQIPLNLIIKIAESYKINLNWLLLGKGSIYINDNNN